IKDMTPSEIFAVMAGGLTTVAGSVLVGYSLLGANLEYLIAASFMAAPAGLLMAKMLVPAGALADIGPNAETATTPDAPVVDPDDDGDTSGRGGSRLAAAFRRGSRRGGTHEGRDELVRRARGADAPEEDEEEPPVNVIDAAARGASDGLTLALNVGAMLLAFISLIALANIVVGGIGGWFGNDDLSVEEILGYVFSPIMAAVGVPLHEAVDAGSFLGQKVILNEF